MSFWYTCMSYIYDVLRKLTLLQLKHLARNLNKFTVKICLTSLLWIVQSSSTNLFSDSLPQVFCRVFHVLMKISQVQPISLHYSPHLYWAVLPRYGMNLCAPNPANISIPSASPTSQSRNLIWYVYYTLGSAFLIFLYCFLFLYYFWMDGWMNGTHPTVSEGKVTRTVCYHWVSNCCSWSNNIEVLNCGKYYIYKHLSPVDCHSRYCGLNS